MCLSLPRYRLRIFNFTPTILTIYLCKEVNFRGKIDWIITVYSCASPHWGTAGAKLAEGRALMAIKNFKWGGFLGQWLETPGFSWKGGFPNRFIPPDDTNYSLWPLNGDIASQLRIFLNWDRMGLFYNVSYIRHHILIWFVTFFFRVSIVSYLSSLSPPHFFLPFFVI